MINEKNKDTWCVNPFVNLSVHSSGKLKPCCMSKQFYTTEQGDTVSTVSILDLWNSKDRQQVIEDLSNGVKLPGCSFCWKEEVAGKESKRIRDNKEYTDRVTSSSMSPIVVDISLGNLCNLKCRICGPSQSSQWVMEEANLYHPEEKQIFFSKKYFVDMKESFKDDNNLFWNDIVSLLANAEKIDIAGGEPFYINQQWELIKDLANSGTSKKQHIHYNTNGTIFPEKYIEYLNQFKIVDIQISSDGVGKKFEYMRHPANWKEVENNIDKFLELKRTNNNWMIGVCISLSAFNVFDFFETFEHYASKGMLIYVNVVHDHRSSRVLPIEVRNEVIKKIESCNSRYNQRQWIKEKEMICNYLKTMPYQETDWINFVEELKTRDRIRKESYESVFPEFYEIIKKHLKD